jgi:hypothetical protein
VLYSAKHLILSDSIAVRAAKPCKAYPSQGVYLPLLSWRIQRISSLKSMSETPTISCHSAYLSCSTSFVVIAACSLVRPMVAVTMARVISGKALTGYRSARMPFFWTSNPIHRKPIKTCAYKVDHELASDNDLLSDSSGKKVFNRGNYPL